MAIVERKLKAISIMGIMVLSVLGCGGQGGENKKASRSNGKIRNAFIDASRTYLIPERILLAASYLESRINPDPASVMYLNPSSGEEIEKKGLDLAGSAFGLSLTKMGYTEADTPDLAKQIEIYSVYIRSELDKLGVNLSSNPQGSQEKYEWVWLLSQFHRKGESGRRNIRIFFTTEIISILNNGFIWQDPKTGEVIELKKERTPIDIATLQQDSQDSMRLTDEEAQIIGARYIHLPNGQPQGSNEPQGIKVIHCPLSISACLELQVPSETENSVRLRAHYIIPDEFDFAGKPLQVSNHGRSVIVTNSDGSPQEINDSIVIMLVGQSGRYIDGERVAADPSWYSDEQLRALGRVVDGVCWQIGRDYGADSEKCRSIHGDGAVEFSVQSGDEDFIWGNIPDFDETIFGAYIENPVGLTAELAFDFPSSRRTFKSGELIDFDVVFAPTVKLIQVERLVRCSNNRVIWANMRTHEVRSKRKKDIKVALYNAGPNGNGTQFFRTMAYGSTNELLGWSVESIYLENFDADAPAVPPKACLRNGT